MDFKEAYTQLKTGKKIRRKGWQNSFYITMAEFNTIDCYRVEVVPFTYDLSILNSNDWVVFNKDEDNLINVPFNEVIDFLIKGKKAKLPEWPDSCFIELTPNKKELIMYKTCEYDFVPTIECLTNNDWEIIDEA